MEVAAWRKQPVRGAWWLGLSLLVSIVYMQVVVPALGISYGDATSSYPTLFFFWAFAFLSLFELWPFAGLKQPLAGLAAAALTWVLTVVSWSILSKIMDPYGALALVFYALFPLFLIAWFSDYVVPAWSLAQPLKGMVLTLGCLVFGWAVYSLIGAVSQMWLYFIPMWLLAYYDGWPMAGTKYSRWVKIVFWIVVILALTLVLNFLHDLFGAPMSGAAGNDWESLAWLGMTPIYVWEWWLAPGKQPGKGLKLTLLTYAQAVVYAFLYWKVLHLPEWWISAWIFVLWVWMVIIQWMPAPWPSEPTPPA